VAQLILNADSRVDEEMINKAKEKQSWYFFIFFSVSYLPAFLSSPLLAATHSSLPPSLTTYIIF